jgi:hypothetical protein
MNHTILVKWGVLFISGLLMISCSITIPINFTPTNHTEYTLRQVIGGQLCTSACWQSLTPGVNTLQDVDDLLSASNVVPYIVWRLEDESPLTYEWKYIGPEMPNAGLEQLRDAMVVFGEDRTVIRVVILADLCVTTVINEYGVPEKIVQDIFGDIQLLYPQESLVFTAESSKISVIARVAPNEFPDGNNIPLWKLTEGLTDSCIDAFSRQSP